MQTKYVKFSVCENSCLTLTVFLRGWILSYHKGVILISFLLESVYVKEFYEVGLYWSFYCVSDV